MIKQKQLRILVADDDIMIGVLLKDQAMEYGTTDLATNGRDALKAFRLAHEEGKPYDIVFLDLLMPGMDGQSTLEAMRTFESAHHPDRNTDCTIIMITASREPNDILEAYKNKCNGFLTKPVSWNTILDLLQHVRILPQQQSPGAD